MNELTINLTFQMNKQEIEETRMKIKEELYLKGYTLHPNGKEGLSISIEQHYMPYDDYFPGNLSVIEITQKSEKKNRIAKGKLFDVLYKKEREFFDQDDKAIEFILKKIPACKIK